MQIPKKMSETIIAKNKYLQVKEKIFLEVWGTKSNFLSLGSVKEIQKWIYVLPILSTWDVLYIKEYRTWPEKVVIGFPVWFYEEDLTEVENAVKELQEETWYFSDEIEYIWKSIVENYIEWEMKYYIAKNCYKVGDQALEVWENIEVHISSIEDFETMILNWEVESSKAAYIFLLARRKWLI